MGVVALVRLHLLLNVCECSLSCTEISGLESLSQSGTVCADSTVLVLRCSGLQCLKCLLSSGEMARLKGTREGLEVLSVLRFELTMGHLCLPNARHAAVNHFASRDQPALAAIYVALG